MSKKTILLNEQIEQIKKFVGLNEKVSTQEISDALSEIVHKNATDFVEIVFKEADYKKYSTEFISCLKKLNVNYSTLIVAKSCENFYLSKTLSSISKKVCIVVGDGDFIKATNIFCSQKNVLCYAFLTTPYFTELLNDEYNYIERGRLKTKKVKELELLVINENLIKKCNVYEVLKSYSYNLLQAVTLIDYKFSSMLLGKIVDDNFYKLLKQGLSYTLNFSAYDSPSIVLTLSTFIINVVDKKSNIIKNSTAQNYLKIMRLTNEDASFALTCFKGFEKLIKLYHFYFNNDFNGVLLYPDYVNDIEKLSLITLKEQDELYKNLKVPSAKRVELINKLTLKVGAIFLKETSVLLKVLPNIEKAFYLQLKKERAFKDIDIADIKNALRLSTYLTESQNVLVVMRDLGLLNW